MPTSDLTVSRVVHEAATEIEIRPGRRISLSIHEGTRADITIFLCHGAGGNKNQWRHQWVALIEAGYRVVAWDMPGHGLSPQPHDESVYRGSEMVADYREILGRFGTARNILAAHSYGTSLTLALVQGEALPVPIEGILLLGPPPPSVDLRVTPLSRWPLWFLILMRPLLSRGFRRAAWAPEAAPELVAFEEAATKGNRLSMMKALFVEAARPDPDRLGSIEAPITVLAGAADRLTPAVGARALTERLSRAQLRVFEACGHQIMLERPGETTRHLFALIEGGTAPVLS